MEAYSQLMRNDIQKAKTWQMFQSIRRLDGRPAYGPELPYGSPPSRDFYGSPVAGSTPYSTPLNPSLGLPVVPNYSLYPAGVHPGTRPHENSPSPNNTSPSSSNLPPHQPAAAPSTSPSSVSFHAVATVVPHHNTNSPAPAPTKESSSIFRPYA